MSSGERRQQLMIEGRRRRVSKRRKESGSRCRRFFFFQAEDGIRYSSVTGVQTCALPISWRRKPATRERRMPCQRRRSAPVALPLRERATGLNPSRMARPPTPARPHKGGGEGEDRKSVV